MLNELEKKSTPMRLGLPNPKHHMLTKKNKPISPLGENRKSRRKRQFATKVTLKQKPLPIGAIMALENLQRMFEDKNEQNI